MALEVPSHLYVDSSVLVGAVVAGLPDSAACLKYCGEIAAAGTRVYFSELLYLEFANALAMLARRPHLLATLEQSLRDRYRLEQWTNDAGIRRAWLNFGERELDRLLEEFDEYVVVPIDGQLIENAVSIMADCNLQSNDALHVATARMQQVPALATTDGAFENARELVKVILVRDAPPVPQRPSR